MKVLIIPAWYPSGADKLMGQYHKEFAEALNKYNIDTNILFIQRERLSEPLKFLFKKKKQVIKENNYNTYLYSMLDTGKIDYNWQIKRYVKKLDKAFKDYLRTNEKPDVLHAMVTIPSGYATCILGKKYGIPVVATEHGSLVERFFKNEKYKKYGEYVLQNSLYSTVSNFTRELVLKYTDECFILPNQVNVELFHSNIKRHIDGTFNLVSLCALREGKRLDIAFKAIKILRDSGLDIHYDIIGDGFFEGYYKSECHDEGLDDCVSFLGRKNKEEAAKIFESEHALIISSELESFAIPGVEAMAAGMPVISTTCKGPEEYMNSKTGVLCNVNDPQDMARAIKYVYDHYDEYDKKELVRQAKEYDESHVVNTAKKIYMTAIKNSGKNTK